MQASYFPAIESLGSLHRPARIATDKTGEWAMYRCQRVMCTDLKLFCHAVIEMQGEVVGSLPFDLIDGFLAWRRVYSSS